MKTGFQLALLLSIGAFLMSPYAVQAQPAQRGGDPLTIYKAAGATPEQQDKIRDMVNKYEHTAQGKIEKAQKLMHKLHDLSLQPMPDEKDAMGTQDELNKLQSDLSSAHLRLLLDIRKTLSPDQRKKLVDEMRAHAGGAGGR